MPSVGTGWRKGGTVSSASCYGAFEVGLRKTGLAAPDSRGQVLGLSQTLPLRLCVPLLLGGGGGHLFSLWARFLISKKKEVEFVMFICGGSMEGSFKSKGKA